MAQTTMQRTREHAIDLRMLRGGSPAVHSPAPMNTDAALVGAALDGDRASFGRLHELYAPLVHGILLSRVPYREVGDLVQDVFLVALKSLHSLENAAAFGPWIATIARNRAVDYHR